MTSVVQSTDAEDARLGQCPGMTLSGQRFARIVAVPAEWWPEEIAQAGPEHLDPEYVAEFDRKSPTDWSAAVESLSELGVGPTSTVIDLGAVTGDAHLLELEGSIPVLSPRAFLNSLS